MVFAEDSCGICLDFIKNDPILDSCDHKFCIECIKQWVENSSTCPQCRKEITKINFQDEKGNGIEYPVEEKSQIEEESDRGDSSDLYETDDNDLNRIQFIHINQNIYKIPLEEKEICDEFNQIFEICKRTLGKKGKRIVNEFLIKHEKYRITNEEYNEKYQNLESLLEKRIDIVSNYRKVVDESSNTPKDLGKEENCKKHKNQEIIDLTLDETDDFIANKSKKQKNN